MKYSHQSHLRDAVWNIDTQTVDPKASLHFYGDPNLFESVGKTINFFGQIRHHRMKPFPKVVGDSPRPLFPLDWNHLHEAAITIVGKEHLNLNGAKISMNEASATFVSEGKVNTDGTTLKVGRASKRDLNIFANDLSAEGATFSTIVSNIILQGGQATLRSLTLNAPLTTYIGDEVTLENMTSTGDVVVQAGHVQLAKEIQVRALHLTASDVDHDAHVVAKDIKIQVERHYRDTPQSVTEAEKTVIIQAPETEGTTGRLKAGQVVHVKLKKADLPSLVDRTDAPTLVADLGTSDVSLDMHGPVQANLIVKAGNAKATKPLHAEGDVSLELRGQADLDDVQVEGKFSSHSHGGAELKGVINGESVDVQASVILADRTTHVHHHANGYWTSLGRKVGANASNGDLRFVALYSLSGKGSDFSAQGGKSIFSAPILEMGSVPLHSYYQYQDEDNSFQHSATTHHFGSVSGSNGVHFISNSGSDWHLPRLEFNGVNVVSGGDIIGLTEGHLLNATVHNMTSTSSHTKSDGGWFGHSSEHHHESHTSTPIANTFKAKGKVVMGGGASATHISPNIKYGEYVDLNCYPTPTSIVLDQASSFSSDRKTSSDMWWQSMKSWGHKSVTALPARFVGPGDIRVSGGNGVYINRVAGAPKPTWLKKLELRDDVVVTPVYNSFDDWGYEVEGLTGAAKIAIVVVIAAVTYGVGAAAAPAAAGGMAAGGTAATATAATATTMSATMATAAAQAAVISVSSQAAISTIETGSPKISVKETLISIGAAALTAGICHELGLTAPTQEAFDKAEKFNSAIPQSEAILKDMGAIVTLPRAVAALSVAQKLGAVAVGNAVNTAANIARGSSVEEAVVQGIRSGVAGAIATPFASIVGDAYQTGQIDLATRLAAHGAIGAAHGFIGSGDPASGALAGLGEGVAHVLGGEYPNFTMAASKTITAFVAQGMGLDPAVATAATEIAVRENALAHGEDEDEKEELEPEDKFKLPDAGKLEHLGQLIRPDFADPELVEFLGTKSLTKTELYHTVRDFLQGKHGRQTSAATSDWLDAFSREYTHQILRVSEKTPTLHTEMPENTSVVASIARSLRDSKLGKPLREIFETPDPLASVLFGERPYGDIVNDPALSPLGADWLTPSGYDTLASPVGLKIDPFVYGMIMSSEFRSRVMDYSTLERLVRSMVSREQQPVEGMMIGSAMQRMGRVGSEVDRIMHYKAPFDILLAWLPEFREKATQKLKKLNSMHSRKSDLSNPEILPFFVEAREDIKSLHDMCAFYATYILDTFPFSPANKRFPNLVFSGRLSLMDGFLQGKLPNFFAFFTPKHPEGPFLVVAHGNPSHVLLQNEALLDVLTDHSNRHRPDLKQGILLTAKELVKFILRSKQYTPGTDIFLQSCNTGKLVAGTNIAQKLANILQVNVIAPNSISASNMLGHISCIKKRTASGLLKDCDFITFKPKREVPYYSSASDSFSLFF